MERNNVKKKKNRRNGSGEEGGSSNVGNVPETAKRKDGVNCEA